MKVMITENLQRHCTNIVSHMLTEMSEDPML